MKSIFVGNYRNKKKLSIVSKKTDIKMSTVRFITREMAKTKLVGQRKEGGSGRGQRVGRLVQLVRELATLDPLLCISYRCRGR